jgi:hypothetical protein
MRRNSDKKMLKRKFTKEVKTVNSIKKDNKSERYMIK